MDKPDLHIIASEVSPQMADAVAASPTRDVPAFEPPPAAVVNGVVQPVVARVPDPDAHVLPGMTPNELRSQAAVMRSQHGVDYLAAKSFESLAAEKEAKQKAFAKAKHVKYEIIRPEIQWYAAEIEKRHNEKPGLVNPVTIGLIGAGAALAQYVFYTKGERRWGDAAFQVATGFVAGAVVGLVLAVIAEKLHVVKLPLALPLEVQQRFHERAVALGKQISSEDWQLLETSWAETVSEWNSARKSLADYVVSATQGLQPVAQTMSALASARR